VKVTKVGESGNAGRGAERNRAFEIRAGVPFFQESQHPVVDCFNRAGDKRTAGSVQQRQRVGVLQQVLDLDGHVVGDAGALASEALDDRLCVTDAVEEVRIAESDVAGAGGDLCACVGENDLRRDDPEAAVIDRHDRAMPAAVFAAAARLGVTGDALFTARLQAGVSRQRRQAGSIRDLEDQPRDALSIRIRRGWRQGGGCSPGCFHQRCLVLTTQDFIDTARPEQFGIERGVETVGNETHVRVQSAHAVDHRERQPRRRVHREEEPHHSGRTNDVLRQAVFRQIGAADLDPRVAQPRCGRRQPKRLTTHVVGR
jgi:hypothetical protein